MQETDARFADSSMRGAVLAAFPNERAKDPAAMAPAVLAYVGDTVYDLYVRTLLLTSTDLNNHDLHVKAAKHVCAAAQAAAFRRVEKRLSDEELAVFRRGRNAHAGTVPKHAEVNEYRVATGFEALAGYLFLCGRDARLSEIIGAAILGDQETNEEEKG